MIKDISFLYSKTVTNKNNELIQNYIKELSDFERDSFNSITNDIINMNIKITNNAIRLTLKLFKDTNIKVFPYIQKEACRGYSMQDGTYAFSMCLLNSEPYKTIYSYRKIKDLLLKDSAIISDLSRVHDGDMVIDIKWRIGFIPVLF